MSFPDETPHLQRNPASRAAAIAGGLMAPPRLVALYCASQHNERGAGGGPDELGNAPGDSETRGDATLGRTVGLIGGVAMASEEAHVESTDVGRWDPALTRHVLGMLRPLVKLYHRSEVRGLENIPDRGLPGGVQPLRWG